MEDSRVLKEVYEILNNSTTEVNNKIPYRFKRYLYNNMDKEYRVNIKTKKTIREQNISKRAKEILALIYRDYLVDDKERQTLINEETDIVEKMEKYNPDNLFKEKRKTEIKNEEMSLIQYKKESIFKRIIQYFKSIINRKGE